MVSGIVRTFSTSWLLMIIVISTYLSALSP